jgi:DNA-binding NarL/FixJ family response regulator
MHPTLDKWVRICDLEGGEMTKNGQFSVLLCDDSLAMRTALRTLLEADARFEVVGEASDGVEAVEQAGELRPNIILLDVTMPRLTGVEALPKVLRQSPDSTVVLLTAFSREVIENSTAMEVDSLRGVYYMDKTREGEELVNSIAGIAGASLSTSVAREGRRTKLDGRERTRRMMEAMSRNKRVAIAGLAAAAVAVLASIVVIGPARSAAGSCVAADTPYLSHGTLYGKATHKCSGSSKMYAILQGRYGKSARVYTLASGSTTGTFLKIGAQKCALTGVWHTWTLATRALKTDTSGVLSYSCQTSSPSIAKPRSLRRAALGRAHPR